MTLTYSICTWSIVHLAASHLLNSMYLNGSSTIIRHMLRQQSRNCWLIAFQLVYDFQAITLKMIKSL